MVRSSTASTAGRSRRLVAGLAAPLLALGVFAAPSALACDAAPNALEGTLLVPDTIVEEGSDECSLLQTPDEIANDPTGWTPPPLPGLDRLPDDGPVVSIVDTAAQTLENPASATVTFLVTLDAPTTEDVTVTYETADGTATAPGDYEAAVDETVTVLAGTPAAPLTVGVNDDDEVEDDETFTVRLTEATLASGDDVEIDEQNDTGTGTISDDDTVAGGEDIPGIPSSGGPLVIVGPGIAQEPAEAGSTTPMEFPVIVIGPHDDPITLEYSTADDPSPVANATANSDYSPVDQRTVTIAPDAGFLAPGVPVKLLGTPGGAAPSPITVAVRGDGETAPDELPIETFLVETFLVETQTPNDDATLVGVAAEGVIVDEDLLGGGGGVPGVPGVPEIPEVGGTPEFEVSDVTVDEDDGTADFVIRRPETFVGPIDITAATADTGSATPGEDYTPKTETLSFGPDETVKTFKVPVIDEKVHDDGAETFAVVISDQTSALGVDDNGFFVPEGENAVATIRDDDPEPVFSITSIGPVREGSGAAKFSVSATRASDAPVQVSVASRDGSAKAPGDYSAVRGSLTFPANSTASRAFGVTIRNDNVVERAETFSVTISAGSVGTIGRGTAVATILDDDVLTAGSPSVATITPSGNGYWVVDGGGNVRAFGDAPSRATASAAALRADTVAIASDQTGDGLWVLDSAGGVHTRGDAPFFGSIPQRRQQGVPVGQARAVDIASTPAGDGYVILDEVGGVHTFGNAEYHGSIPGLRARGVNIGEARVTSIAIAPGGKGYVILDDHGGVFTFGDAEYHGSIPALRARGADIGQVRFTSIASTPTGDGYLILDERGGVHTFGDAPYHGSIPALRARGVNIGQANATGIELAPGGGGYWIFDTVGGVFTFGDARFHGSAFSS